MGLMQRLSGSAAGLLLLTLINGCATNAGAELESEDAQAPQDLTVETAGDLPLAETSVSSPDGASRDIAEFDAGEAPHDGGAVDALDAAPLDGGCGPELCNGVDDDCNGTVDDIAPAGCLMGACVVAELRCPSGLQRGERFVETAPPVCERLRLAAPMTVCRPSVGPCDPPERCTGESEACPDDLMSVMGTVCRESRSVESCDPAERCAGNTAQCPEDRVERTASPESCDGMDDDCDGMVDNGATCRAGESCVGGRCVGAEGPIDLETDASGITLLRDDRSGALTVVYNHNLAEGLADVRVARFTNHWELTTPFTNRTIQKEGAALDGNGSLHLALGDAMNTAISYATLRSDGWAAPLLLPGMPGSEATLAVDILGAVHVVGSQRLAARRYTTNASGGWLASPILVAPSATAPAAIIASGLGVPVIAHAVWSGRRIDANDGPGSTGATLSRYGVDQGPPISLAERGGALTVAYILTTDFYVNYSVFVQQRPAGGSWSERTELVSRLPPLGPVEVSYDNGGARYVTFCVNDGRVMVASDRSGAWRVTTLMASPCLGSMDALVSDGRLRVAFRTTGGALRLESFDTAGL